MLSFVRSVRMPEATGSSQGGKCAESCSTILASILILFFAFIYGMFSLVRSVRMPEAAGSSQVADIRKRCSAILAVEFFAHGQFPFLVVDGWWLSMKTIRYVMRNRNQES